VAISINKFHLNFEVTILMWQKLQVGMGVNVYRAEYVRFLVMLVNYDVLHEVRRISRNVMHAIRHK